MTGAPDGLFMRCSSGRRGFCSSASPTNVDGGKNGSWPTRGPRLSFRYRYTHPPTRITSQHFPLSGLRGATRSVKGCRPAAPPVLEALSFSGDQDRSSARDIASTEPKPHSSAIASRLRSLSPRRRSAISVRSAVTNLSGGTPNSSAKARETFLGLSATLSARSCFSRTIVRPADGSHVNCGRVGKQWLFQPIQGTDWKSRLDAGVLNLSGAAASLCSSCSMRSSRARRRSYVYSFGP